MSLFIRKTKNETDNRRHLLQHVFAFSWETWSSVAFLVDRTSTFCIRKVAAKENHWTHELPWSKPTTQTLHSRTIETEFVTFPHNSKKFNGFHFLLTIIVHTLWNIAWLIKLHLFSIGWWKQQLVEELKPENKTDGKRTLLSTDNLFKYSTK